MKEKSDAGDDGNGKVPLLPYVVERCVYSSALPVALAAIQAIDVGYRQPCFDVLAREMKRQSSGAGDS